METRQRKVRRWLGVLLIAALVSQPIFGALPARAAPAVQADPAPQEQAPAPAEPQATPGPIYLPFVRDALGAQVLISNPPAGSMVAGSFVLGAQPTHAGQVTSVTFYAGDKLLGTDSTPQDGYSLILHSSQLPDGQVTLRAVGHGPGGDESTQIQVLNVRNPPKYPAAATATNRGAAGASEIGSVVMVPPGGLPSGATLRVNEKTQQEITAETGIEWEEMGVTFLGAQTLESSAPIGKPLVVSSAGFGRRVQPGQAVVNYQLAPDVDGDGVAEIVVVNTASVAPNFDVVSDPRPELAVDEVVVAAAGEQTAIQAAAATEGGLSGAPGTIFEIDVTGFNLYSPAGNVARFKGAGGQEFELPGVVNQHADDPLRQYFSTQIPPLPPGAATVTLVNLSTMATVGPLPVQVRAAPTLSRPASEIIDEFLAQAISYVNIFLQGAPPEVDKATVLRPFLEGRARFAEMAQDPSPETQAYLTQVAQMIITSGALDPDGGLAAAIAAEAQLFGRCFDPRDDGMFSGRRGFKNITLIMVTAVAIAAVLTGGAAAVILGVGAALVGAEREFFDINIPDCPPPPPCPPGGSGGGTTGMGAAPPPGGDMCGGGGGGGGGAAAAGLSSTAIFAHEPGRFKVYVVSNGRRTPFTGSTDRGGYFFLPFIPEGNPFTAYAVDTQTGQIRTYQGIGPATGKSIYVWFDFINGADSAVENRWTGGGDGVSWDDPANWALGREPGPGDRAVLDVAANPTVVIDSAAVANSIQSKEALLLKSGSLDLAAVSTMDAKLTIQGGELKVGGPLTLNGVLEWSSGTVSGHGTVSVKGGALLTGNSSKTLSAVRVDNSSTFNQAGGGDIFAGSGARFNNLTGGVFLLSDAGGVQGFYYGSPGLHFTNQGTIRKTGSAEVKFEATLANQAAPFEVQGGSLTLRRGGSIQGGTATVAAGAALIFQSGTYSLTGTISGNGQGVVRLAGATFTPVSSATLAFPNGGLHWTAGALDGGGSLTLQGKVTVDGVASKQLTGVTVNNQANFRQEGAGEIFGGDGAVINNAAGAVFEITSAAGLQGFYFGGIGTAFNNSGTLRKSGAGDAIFQAIFSNQGALVDVQGGSLVLRRGGQIQGGTATVASGASLDFNSGTYSMTATLSGSGAGQVRLTGATLSPTPNATLNFGNGGLRWTAGALDGAGSLTLQGKVFVSGGSSKQLTGVTVNNQANVRLEGPGGIFGGDGAVINNAAGAIFEMTSAAGLLGFYYGGGGTAFNNSGTLRKSGPGSAIFQVRLRNQGSLINVQSGSLVLQQGGQIQGGTATVASGAFLDFNSGTYSMTATLSGSGAGQVRLTGATLSPSPAGTINLTGGGFTINAGTLIGPGTLTFGGKVTVTGLTSKTFRAVTLTNTGSWLWQSPAPIFSGSGLVFNNQAGAIFTANTSNNVALTWTGNYYGGGTTFNNNGTMVKTGDAAAASIQSVCFNGTVPSGFTIGDTCP
jgi:hypothetical protein